MNQGVDIAITERISLKLAGIVGMTRHMIGADRQAELRVPQNAHDLQEIHLAFIGIHLRKIVEASSDVSHVDLVYLPPARQVLDDREHFRAWIP